MSEKTTQPTTQPPTQQPKPEKKQNRRLTLVLLLISAFFSESCVFMYYGLLGVQASEILHSPAWVATMLPLSVSIVACIAMIPIANHADRTGRRKEWVLVGLAFAVVFNVLMATVTNWPELLIYRIIGGGLFSTVMFIYTVLLIFVLGPQKRGLAVGLFMGVATAGSCLFTVLAGLWSAAATIYGLSGFSFMYLMAAVVAVCAFIFLVPVRVPKYKMPPQPGAVKRAIAQRGVWYAGVVALVNVFGSTAVLVALPVVLGYHLVSTTYIGIIFSINSALNAIGMGVGGGLVDRLGPRTMLVMCGIISGVICLGVPFVGFTWYILAGIVWVVEFFWALMYSGPAASSAHSVQWQLQATAVNVIMVFAGVGGLAGSIVGGILLAAGTGPLGTGWTIVAITSAVFLIVAGILAVGVPRIVKKAEAVPEH